MTQMRRQVWTDVFAVIVTLALGAVLLYALLPFTTTPDQQVVPAPPSMGVNQLLLILFIAATAGGAPLTIGVGLMLLFKFISRRVPASSSVAPEMPAPKAKSRTAEPPPEMSPREALAWKITATLLLLMVGAGALVGLVVLFTQFYK